MRIYLGTRKKTHSVIIRKDCKPYKPKPNQATVIPQIPLDVAETEPDQPRTTTLAVNTTLEPTVVPPNESTIINNAEAMEENKVPETNNLCEFQSAQGPEEDEEMQSYGLSENPKTPTKKSAKKEEQIQPKQHGNKFHYDDLFGKQQNKKRGFDDYSSQHQDYESKEKFPGAKNLKKKQSSTKKRNSQEPKNKRNIGSPFKFG